MNKKNDHSARLFWGCAVICAVSFISVSWTSYNFFSYRSRIVAEAKRSVQSTMDKMVSEIEDHFSRSGVTADSITQDPAALAWLGEKMNSFGLGKKDLGLVLASDGTILYHPISDYVIAQKNIFSLFKGGRAGSRTAEKRRLMLEKAVRGESGEGYNKSRTEESFWYFYRPLRSIHGSLVVNFISDAIPFDGKTMRRQEIGIGLGLIVFIVFLLILLLRLHETGRLTPARLWVISISFSLLCFSTACFIWYLAYSVPLGEYQQRRTVVDDPVSRQKFIAERTKLSETSYGEKPVFIPTGIYVQSLEFTSANSVSVTGYVWQRFVKGRDEGIVRGFVLPEAKTLSVTEAYRQDQGKEELIGWYFEASTRQSFDYSKYPFDHPDIALWLKPKDFLNHVVLIPDLEAYPSMNAGRLPGLQGRLALPGYSFFGTFFSYEPRMRNATMGVAGKQMQSLIPEFFYNVLIRRNFITPLVSKFFPILIVVLMLFTVILSFSADLEKQKSFGLTGLAVVGLVISFLFTTLLNQVDLRQQFGTDRIIFLENFNFITYLILLLAAFQAFLFSAKHKTKFIQYEHCLIPKLLYWPIFTSLVLCASLMYFY